MKDVERVARERAERPKAQVGVNFESARQREKRALVKQLDSLDGSKIRKIAALSDTPDEQKIQNVAAYCRVSTDDQLKALMNVREKPDLFARILTTMKTGTKVTVLEIKDDWMKIVFNEGGAYILYGSGKFAQEGE